MSHAATVAQPRVLADLIDRTRACDAALILTGALFTALCAQISIPIPGSPVPITGQTFAVLLTGAALGANRGAAAQVLYVGLGLFLPFYADGSSGGDVVFGATGGYLVAFPLSAWICGKAAEMRYDRSPVKALPVFALGSLVVFLIGVPWLAASVGVPPAEAIDLGFTPFIAGGIVKAVLAAGLLPSAWKLVR